jgi:tryptophan synthase alpha chain
MRGAGAFSGLFRRLAAERRGAFVPFVVAGDPDLQTSLALLDALVRSGASALEIGIPFSDPVADGPVVQAACARALASGARGEAVWRLIEHTRARHPETPIGLLVYANLVLHAGANRFYARAADAGVDAVLVADVPLRESAPLERAAAARGIAPVLIAPPNADPRRLAAIASRSRGYVYVTSRPGVTGVHETPRHDAARILDVLQRAGGEPALLGFGISRPAHVREALEIGAAGAICGSAIALLIEQKRADPPGLLAALSGFMETMIGAARLPSEGEA